MKTRTISALLGLPLLLGFIYLGGIYIYVASTIIAMVAFFEFTKANHGSILKSAIITSFFIPITFAISYYKAFELLPILTCIVIVTNMTYLVINFEKENINDIAINIFSYFYTVMSFVLLVFIRDMGNGIYFILPIFITAFSSDTFAYFVGKSMGKHKLAPVLSPKKTVEGSVGGILGAGIVMAIYGYVFYDKLSVSMANNSIITMTILFLVFGLIGGAISQIGDLFASAIKRYKNIKDYGKIMPGHGGVLDRFDSVIILSYVFFVAYSTLIYLTK